MPSPGDGEKAVERAGTGRVDAKRPVIQTGHVKTLAASELKARLLAVLDEVERTGEVIVITKRGREVARLVGPARSSSRHPQDELLGTVTVHGDLIEPAVPAEDWAALAEASRVAEPSEEFRDGPGDARESDGPAAGRRRTERKGRSR